MRKQWIPGSLFPPAPALEPGDEANEVLALAVQGILVEGRLESVLIFFRAFLLPYGMHFLNFGSLVAAS